MPPHQPRRPHRHSSHPPPPHERRHGPHEHHAPGYRHLPPSMIRARLLRPERLERLLAPWIRDPEDRAFVVRCMLDEGPIHHRGANYALLALLGLVLERAGGAPEVPTDKPAQGRALPVPLRLPPHLSEERHSEQSFPLQLPLAPLEEIAPPDSPELDAIVDCLLDGPPHHALANAAMVTLLGALLERLPSRS